MAKHRTHSAEFKRQIAQEFLTGDTLHGLAKRRDLSRNLIRIEAAGLSLTERMVGHRFDVAARNPWLEVELVTQRTFGNALGSEDGR